MADAQSRADAVFEISWEVCNKVGGIHTVLRSKVPAMLNAYAGKRYILIGPWNARAGGEFEERPTPADMISVLDAARNAGIPAVYGVWRVAGEPSVILVDFRSLFARANDLKRRYWERFGIDALGARYDYDEPLCFATAAGIFIEQYAQQHPGRIIAHAHEWMAGFAILHLRAANANVATVFTTHATILGRSIMGSGQDLYALIDLPGFDARAHAYRLGVQEKHLTETACAKEADAFTTVSDITAREATRILERVPDEVTYNGFHVDRFPTFEETSVRHEATRDLLRDLTAAMCFPEAPFDLENTVLIVTSGRYEMRNKGLDVIIRALAQINERLRKEGSKRTIVMLFFVIRDRGPLRQDVLERWSAYQRIRSAVDWEGKRILRRVALDLFAGKTPGGDDLFTSGIIEGLRESAAEVTHSGQAPIATHHITDETHDPILVACKAAGLHNGAEDRVKVLFLPGMFDGADGLLNLPYYDALVGAHLGLFPSAYEPWGYTPLESAILGVPTITTDAAGFGQYARATAAQHDTGVIVLPRLGVGDDAFTRHLAESLLWFIGLDHAERVTHGFSAKRIAESCNWTYFIPRYLRAHECALAKRGR